MASHMRAESWSPTPCGLQLPPGRERDRSDLPCGPRIAIHIGGVRAGQRRVRHPQKHGQSRLKYDNALAESLWQGLKRETMHKKLFVTMSQARLEIFEWLTYYNARRRHISLSYLSSMEFEQQHHQQVELSLAA